METESIWSQIITSLGPLLGVVVGALATYVAQTNSLKKQWEREEAKEKEKKHIEKLLMYSEILKLDGEHLMQVNIGGGYNEFNTITFNEKFRPVFFSKFYLIDQNIADNIRNMDFIIAAGNYFEELEQQQEDELIILYTNIIRDIENHIKMNKLN
ncbi:hypothetical protein ACFPRA_01270 [Sporosarcina soli]|uniref:Uncharacterized protein n=1 Tax=Sporosarcina soli TaxID=334736 RepID=A0ABW0TDQ3_9BACL